MWFGIALAKRILGNIRTDVAFFPSFSLNIYRISFFLCEKYIGDLCDECATNSLKFDELGGIDIERDERFPIRVTLQYYKSTDNGEVSEEIMKGIAELLESSQKISDFVGSLVTEDGTSRPTDWKQLQSFLVGKENKGLIKGLKETNCFERHFPAFAREEITDDVLKIMEKDDLKALIPKLGPRLKFWRWVEKWKESTKAKASLNILRIPSDSNSPLPVNSNENSKGPVPSIKNGGVKRGLHETDFKGDPTSHAKFRSVEKEVIL